MEWLKFVIDYGIIGFLILLSMIAIGIAIERFHVFKHIKLDDFPDQKSLELELTKKIHLIATIGSNAPYIGLVGNGPGHHAHFLYDRTGRFYGHGQDHGRLGPGLEGHGHRSSGGHSLRLFIQFSA